MLEADNRIDLKKAKGVSILGVLVTIAVAAAGDAKNLQSTPRDTDHSPLIND